MSRFIKAKQGLKHAVIYTDDAGKHFRFSSGTWTWRNHNPGNLRPGYVSKRFGQIGVAGGFAVFSTYEIGHNAMIYLLRHTYRNDSIDKLVKAYAPPIENNTAAYIKFLRQKTGIKDNKKIKVFTPKEFEKLWKAIIQMEGYKKGKITEVYKITHVHDSGACIYAYYIDSLGWIPKNECIKLARRGKLDVVICQSCLGNTYLRSRPDQRVGNNFSHMVV